MNSDNQGDVDQIIRVLIARLPKSGDVWPEAERKLWLDLLTWSFKLIYKDAPPETQNAAVKPLRVKEPSGGDL